MTVSSTNIHPDLADPDTLRTSACALAQLASTGRPVPFGPALTTVPAPVAEMMARALAELASGNTIRLSVFGGELSTQEVADLLGVSRPFVVKEIEEGRLPARKVGPRRRVAKSDFIAYRHKLDAKQQHSLNELAGIDQELGLVSTFPVGDTSIPLSQNRELGTND